MSKKQLFTLILTGGVILVGIFSANNALAPISPQSTTVDKKESVPATSVTPAKKSLTVPYTVQAPFANWKIHDESCEEAAVLMYHNFLGANLEDINPTVADKEMRAMKAWQVNHYSSEPDLSIEDLGEFTRDYYGHSYRIIADITVDDVKKEIAKGRPVLVPVMTHSLKNPHYNVTDSYHILLIKGYDETGVITNDAGVREGKDYHYTWEVLFSAIDAQTPKLKQGRLGLIFNLK